MVKAAKKSAPKRPAPKTTISLRLQPRHIAHLDALSEKLGVNRSSLIQLAISEYLDRHPV